MTDLELKPCPFCGQTLIVKRNYISHPDNPCLLRQFGLSEEQVEAWNTRPEADTLSQMREAIVALADAADKCAEAPHFIIQPFLGIYREHGETIAAARATTTKIEKDAR